MRKFRKALKFLRKKVFKPFIKAGLMRLIVLYQRRLSRHTCLYSPTCSEYTLQAINNRGVILGVFAGLWRIMRCNPLSKGGYDPAPERLFKFKWIL